MLNIINCDCMDLMKEYPDKHFELAIVDPPYGIGNWIDDKAYYKDGRRRHSVSLTSKKVPWNKTIPGKDYFLELYRISQNQIIWGANYYNCFGLLGGAIVWYKGDGNPVYSFCEIASLSFQKKVDYVHINWQSGFYRASIEKIIHPCQKPVALYEWLLTKYAKKGDKILDTHLGSGSIAIACHNLGFDLTACELDKDYYDAAMKRITFHQAQGRLF
mgnify:FL=1